MDPPMNPPQPLPEVEHLEGQNYLFHWEGILGRVSFIQTSSALTANEFDWKFVPDIRVGNGSQIEMGFQATASHYEFFRLICYDYTGDLDPNLADFDNDGYTNLEESFENTDPFDDLSFPSANGGDANGIISLLDPNDDNANWNHPWEYKLTFKTNDFTTTRLINPHDPLGSFAYAMGDDIFSELEFDDMTGINRATFIQLEPNLDYDVNDPESRKWILVQFIELSENNPKWTRPASSGTKPIGYILPWEIGVDNNRNGDLVLAARSDKTSLSEPYRFWLNNDDDSGWGDDTYVANRDNPWRPKDLDNSDNQIGQVRDLDDFSRIHLNVRGLHDLFADGTFTLGLKWKNIQERDPAVRLFKASEADGGTKYLSEVSMAASQISLPNSYLGEIQENVLYLPMSFWNVSTGLNHKHLIYEGLGEGKGELTLVLKQDDHVLGEGGSVFFDLLDVRKMYQQWGVASSAVIPDPDLDTETVVTGVSPQQYLTRDINGDWHYFEPAWDEDLEDKHYAIHVHGWRKGGPAAATPEQYFKGRSDEITMFKRLWHRGFKGRYIGFIWPTYDVEVVDENGEYDGIRSAVQSKFNHSEYRAWKSGKAFKEMVDGLSSDYEIKVFAHSMGNIVVSSALEKGMSVDNFCLLNAAISARCFHQDAPLTLAHVPLDEDLSDDPKPWVRALSYKGNAAGGLARLEAVEGEITNFYLPNDSALGWSGWKLNNSLLKPDPLSSYEYENIPAIDFHEVQWDPIGLALRVITDPHEAMAMVNCSWSEAIGSTQAHVDPTSGKGIDANVNLALPPFLFGAEHEAAFKWQPAKTWRFYAALWSRLELPGNATE